MFDMLYKKFTDPVISDNTPIIYGLNPARYGTHFLIAEEINSGNKILDVGCNRGYLKLLSIDNIYFGIDNNSKDLREAIKIGYKQIYEFDLNNFLKFKIKEKFDVIVFADILEHLLYPDKVLLYFIDNFLKKRGRVIISLPNVANFTIRLSLLFGSFVYRESGILDKTHLHLYTLKTARKMITGYGLEIIKEKFSSNKFGRVIKMFPFLGTLLGYNLIFICNKK